jgi:hypothetical protein
MPIEAFAEMYAEMKVGSHAVLNSMYQTEMGQMHKTFWEGTQCLIVGGHDDNDGLEPAYKLWRVEIEDGDAKYQLWFRAHKLGLEA